MDNKDTGSRAGRSGKYNDHYNFGGQPIPPANGGFVNGREPGGNKSPSFNASPGRNERPSPYNNNAIPGREIRPPAQPFPPGNPWPPPGAVGREPAMPVGMPEQYLQNQPQGGSNSFNANDKASPENEPTHVRARDAQTFEPTRVRTAHSIQMPVNKKRAREDTHVLEVPSFMREGARYAGHKKAKLPPEKKKEPERYDAGPLEIPSFMNKNAQQAGKSNPAQQQSNNAAAQYKPVRQQSGPPQHQVAQPPPKRNPGPWQNTDAGTQPKSSPDEPEKAQPPPRNPVSKPKTSASRRKGSSVAQDWKGAENLAPTAQAEDASGESPPQSGAEKEGFLPFVRSFLKKVTMREENMQGSASLTAGDKAGKQKIGPQRFDAGPLEAPFLEYGAAAKDESLRPGSFALRSRVGRIKDDPENSNSWQEKVDSERRVAARESAMRERNRAAAKGRVAANIGRETQYAESQLNYRPRITRIKNRRNTSAHRVKTKRRNREIVGWVLSITLAIAAALLIRAFVFEIILVDGDSMLPTLHSDERVAIEKVSRYGGLPDRGDIVIVEYPNLTGTYVKRTIGLPGETVEVKDSTVYINGQPLSEPYVSSDKYQDMAPVVVPEDHIFVMGDNRAHSLDSRTTYIGPISKDALIGHGLFVIWPFDSMRWIQSS